MLFFFLEIRGFFKAREHILRYTHRGIAGVSLGVTKFLLDSAHFFLFRMHLYLASNDQTQILDKFLTVCKFDTLD